MSDLSSSDSAKFRQSTVGTRFFRGIFAFSVIAFVALFLGFYGLIFEAIGDAITVQSGFFVDRINSNVKNNYDRVFRETSTLLKNKSVTKYLSARTDDADAIEIFRKRIDEFVTWWLSEVDNRSYAAITYLNSEGLAKLVYKADIENVNYSDDASRSQPVDQSMANSAQGADGSPEKIDLVGMVYQTWKQTTFPLDLYEYSLVLPDSTRLFRTIRPILERKTRETIGFLAIDLHFEHIFGADIEADRRLLLASLDNKKIIHDASYQGNNQKHVDKVYPGLLDILSEQEGESGTINLSYESEKSIYNVYSVTLEDRNWLLNCLVDESDYMDKAKNNGEILIITALLFVAVAGASIFILTRRVEDRTQRLVNIRDQLMEELNAAHELQMGLMPQKSPENAAIDVAGKCQPAAQVGGDFFQYYEPEQNRVIITMADVTGHGMRAAVPTMVFSGLLSNQISYSNDIKDLFTRLNSSLLSTLERRTFICFALGEIDTQSKTVRIANSGCPYPYHYSAEDKTLHEIDVSALPLGLRSDSDYPVTEIEVSHGDRIIFCSDGIIEATNSQGEIFGFDNTADMIKLGCERDLKSQELIDFVFNQVGKHSGEEEQEDDQTIVVLACT